MTALLDRFVRLDTKFVMLTQLMESQLVIANLLADMAKRLDALEERLATMDDLPR